MDSWEGSQLNTAKEILAFELTKLVHGEEEAEKLRKQQERCLVVQEILTICRRMHCQMMTLTMAQ